MSFLSWTPFHISGFAVPVPVLFGIWSLGLPCGMWHSVPYAISQVCVCVCARPYPHQHLLALVYIYIYTVYNMIMLHW